VLLVLVKNMARLFAVICAACFFVSAYAQDDTYFDRRLFTNKLEDLTFYREGMQGCRIFISEIFILFSPGEYEYESYDGWYNNPAHPEWGGAGMPTL